MILNDLFENKLSDIHAAYRDYLRIGKSLDRAKQFKEIWGMDPITWVKYHLDDINRLTAHERQQPAPDAHLFHEGAMKDLHTELADKYHELAPKIEKYRDSYLAGELYDALEEIAARHGAMKEFRSMLNGARNRAHMDYDTNPGGFQNWFWYLPFANDIAEADRMTASGRARQQASRYNPDSETYRAQPIPKVSDKDITQKSQQVSRVSHRDLVTRQDDLDDPIEKTELNIDRKKLQQLIKSQIKTLKPVEQEILIDRYWHELPYSKIGQRLNLSVERIRQIEAKALRKMRHPTRSVDTKPFLDPDFVKPVPAKKTTRPNLADISNPELAYKTGYNDAITGKQHKFKYAFRSSNEPYDAGYKTGQIKLQSGNLDRTSDMAEGLRDPADNPCWKGYKPVGTKKKNGRTVPNCVPKE